MKQEETLDGGLVTLNNISEKIDVTLGYNDYRGYGLLTANLVIQLSETLSGELVNINNISETIDVTLGYGSYSPLTANLLH